MVYMHPRSGHELVQPPNMAVGRIHQPPSESPFQDNVGALPTRWLSSPTNSVRDPTSSMTAVPGPFFQTTVNFLTFRKCPFLAFMHWIRVETSKSPNPT